FGTANWVAADDHAGHGHDEGCMRDRINDDLAIVARIAISAIVLRHRAAAPQSRNAEAGSSGHSELECVPSGKLHQLSSRSSNRDTKLCGISVPASSEWHRWGSKRASTFV